MTALILALIAGALYTGSNLVARKVLKDGSDAWSYSFIFSSIGLIVTLPLLLVEYLAAAFNNTERLSESAGHEPSLLILVVIAMGLIVVAHNAALFSANNYISPSVNGSIYKLRLIWLALIGTVFFQESLTDGLKLGTLLVVASGVILAGGMKGKKSLLGITLVAAASVFYAVGLSASKFLLTDLTSLQVTTLVFAVPAALNLPIIYRRRERFLALWQKHKKLVLMGGVLGAFANICVFAALATENISVVPLLIEAFLVVTFAGEIIILRERENLKLKLLAVALSILGSILVL